MTESETRSRGLWLPLLLGALLIYVGLVLHHRALVTFINGEDCLWIRGDDFGWGDRTIQRYLLQQLYPRNLGDRLEPLYALAVGLHLLIGLQLYALFVRLPASLGLTVNRASIHLGGATAGLLYLLFHSTNLGYLSALSYQLCTLLLLAGLTVALAYFQRPRWKLWLLLAGVYYVGLNTHPFIHGLPLLVGLFELSRVRTAGGGGAAFHWRRAALRYGALALVLALHLAAHMDTLGLQLSKRPDPPGFGLLSEPGHVFSFFASAAQFYFQRFSAGNLPALDWPRVAPVTLPGALGLLVPLVFALGLAGACLAWANRLRQRRPAGLTGAAALLLVVWNLSIYLQARHAPYMSEASWRYELTVAGYCLLAALVALVLGGRLAARFLPGKPWLAGALLFAPLLGYTLAASVTDQIGFGYVVIRADPLTNPGSCPVAPVCAGKTPPRLTGDGPSSQGSSLACADLSGLDLRGLDFRGRNLAGANLTGADLTGARMEHTVLRGACLNWANLAGANLTGADLRGARLTGVVLNRATLCNAKIEGLKDACATHMVSNLVKGTCP